MDEKNYHRCIFEIRLEFRNNMSLLFWGHDTMYHIDKESLAWKKNENHHYFWLLGSANRKFAEHRKYDGNIKFAFHRKYLAHFKLNPTEAVSFLRPFSNKIQQKPFHSSDPPTSN